MLKLKRKPFPFRVLGSPGGLKKMVLFYITAVESPTSVLAVD